MHVSVLNWKPVILCFSHRQVLLVLRFISDYIYLNLETEYSCKMYFVFCLFFLFRMYFTVVFCFKVHSMMLCHSVRCQWKTSTWSFEGQFPVAGKLQGMSQSFVWLWYALLSCCRWDSVITRCVFVTFSRDFGCFVTYVSLYFMNVS